MTGIRLAFTVVGREALELAELGQHVARRAQVDLGPELAHELARALARAPGLA